MPRCTGKGYDECDSCVNAEFDPFECDDCEDGSNWEPFDSDGELTTHELKFHRHLETA
ncbi:hypothetical protein [Herbaspirillum huttiense]|uniref:Uncharacterized protein n=1 Tax=Herbaspirillum huttiense subsp. lycopersici TaxID=3074428 RepID=A0ABU2EFW9_9BURK|nr:hypothetical protein [Herbaspirillum huttiense]MDR9847036.1 hypothetical protein [Herbaspirillum huttiense SE1]